MTEAHKAGLRRIFLTAWSFARSEPSRSFADCLRGAWALTRKLAEAASKLMARAARSGGRLSLASPIYSPTSRTVGGARYSGWQDRQAGRSISAFGR